MACPFSGGIGAACPVTGAEAAGGGAAARLPTSEKVKSIVEQVLGLQAAHEGELAQLRQEYESEIQRLKSQQGVPGAASLGPHGSVLGLPRAGDVNDAFISVFSYEKHHFLEIVRGAVKGPESAEYRKLYAFLLRCFTVADNNHDGKVGFHEFEMLLETASSLPRKFGYAPTTPEMYATEWDRLRERMLLFNSLASCSQGSTTEAKYVTFSSWLHYAIEHIKKKATKLDSSDDASKMTTSKEAFLEFILQATSSRASKEYKEFYHFTLKCFADADKQCNGQIDLENFDMLIETAAEAPRRFGFAPKTTDMYSTEEQKMTARRELFESLDSENRGFIDFDQWLHYLYGHICQKTQQLGKSGEVPRVMPACPTTGSSSGMALWDGR